MVNPVGIQLEEAALIAQQRCFGALHPTNGPATRPTGESDMKSGLRALLGCSLLLMGCGGGGSGSDGVSVVPGVTPTPSPAPNPTPSPTPPAGPATGEVKPTSDAVVSAATLELTRTTVTTSARSVQGDASFQLSYSAATRIYTLTDAIRTRAFGPSQFIEETSAPAFPPGVTFARNDGGGREFLLIAKAPNASPPVINRYGAYGAWQHTEDQASATRIRLNYFTYGSPTPVAAMPSSGKVRYRVTGTGNYARDDGLFITTSDTFVDVDFAAGTIFAVPGLTGDDFLTGGFGGLIGFRTRGVISGNTSTGDIESDIATVRGRFKYIFYGPNAEELAIVFSGGDDRASFVSAGVGIRFQS